MEKRSLNPSFPLKHLTFVAYLKDLQCLLWRLSQTAPWVEAATRSPREPTRLWRTQTPLCCSWRLDLLCVVCRKHSVRWNLPYKLGRIQRNDLSNRISSLEHLNKTSSHDRLLTRMGKTWKFWKGSSQYPRLALAQSLALKAYRNESFHQGKSEKKKKFWLCETRLWDKVNTNWCKNNYWIGDVKCLDRIFC